MRVVVALGGNALARDGGTSIADQRAVIGQLGEPLAGIARQHELVVTHGNGPQVGLLAQWSRSSGVDYPLDVLCAQTAGMIGYLLQQELGNRLGPQRVVVTVLTRTLVSGDDAAFDHPTKPIGPPGQRWAVPSPQPLAIVDAEPISWILDRGGIPVCGGGGGVPVTAQTDGTLVGVEAVVDKDLASAELAIELGADRLVLATDVPNVIEAWGTPQARAIVSAAPRSLDPSSFDSGSMGPKVAAACRFASATAGECIIGSVDEVAALVAGTAGTRVSGQVRGIHYGAT